MGEMAYAREIAKRRRRELRLLDPHASERLFGAQIATNSIAEGAAAAEAAARAGATWVDLNCGCPTRDVLRRGLGRAAAQADEARAARRGIAALAAAADRQDGPRRPRRRSRAAADAVVAGARSPPRRSAAAPPPPTPTPRPPAAAARRECAVALARSPVAGAGRGLGARPPGARYKNPADSTIERSRPARGRTGAAVPGNGDVLTWREAEARAARGATARARARRPRRARPAVDLRRAGAATGGDGGRARERHRKMTLGFRDQCGDDAHGRRHAWYFLPALLVPLPLAADLRHDEARRRARRRRLLRHPPPRPPVGPRDRRPPRDAPRPRAPPPSRPPRVARRRSRRRVATRGRRATSMPAAVAPTAATRRLAEWERGAPADAGARAPLAFGRRGRVEGESAREFLSAFWKCRQELAVTRPTHATRRLSAAGPRDPLGCRALLAGCARPPRARTRARRPWRGLRAPPARRCAARRAPRAARAPPGARRPLTFVAPSAPRPHGIEACPCRRRASRSPRAR